MPTLDELRNRINLRLEESFVGISEQVSDLAPADLVELLNQLNLIEAATVLTMLPVSRAVELIDLPTMSRRSANPFLRRWYTNSSLLPAAFTTRAVSVTAYAL